MPATHRCWKESLINVGKHSEDTKSIIVFYLYLLKEISTFLWELHELHFLVHCRAFWHFHSALFCSLDSP